MRIARVSSFGPPAEAVEVVEVPDPPPPGPGEVTVAAELVPLNPADLLNLEGHYGAAPPPLPLFPGTEGVGRVVALGEGVTHVKAGDRVLMPGPTWRERANAKAASVFALPANVAPEQLAMLRVNPPTAWLMLHSASAPKPGQWVIQNAANSGVGNLVIRLAKREGVRTVNVVRRPELAGPLLAVGADLVLVDGPDLDARVRSAIGDAPLPLAFDAVGGAATQRLARCVSDGGTVLNYGLLSGEACVVDGRDTVFRDVRLHGFWLRKWFLETPGAEIAALVQKLAALQADGTLAVAVEATYPFARLREAVAHATRPGRSGKVLVRFPGA